MRSNDFFVFTNIKNERKIRPFVFNIYFLQNRQVVN